MSNNRMETILKPPSILEAMRFVSTNSDIDTAKEKLLPEEKIALDLLQKNPGKFITELNSMEKDYMKACAVKEKADSDMAMLRAQEKRKSTGGKVDENSQRAIELAENLLAEISRKASQTNSNGTKG